jgi:hypothetical protein
MKRALLLCGLSLLMFSQVNAQFILKGEFRPRFEYRGGYGQILSQNQDPILTISERARLSAYYQTGILSFGLAVQDVRVWGDDDMYSYTAVTGSKASTDLNEGWLGIKPYKNGFIKIGRQYWIYEDERLLSQRSWNQSEAKYDGVLLQHISKVIQVDAGLSWNNNQELNYDDPYPSAKMKSLNFIYLKKNINDWMYLSAMAVASGFSKTDTTTDINRQGTYGGYLSIKKGGLTGLASGFYQNGDNRKGLNTSAYMFAVNADYLIKKVFSIGAGIDYLSGKNEESEDAAYLEKGHTFDNLYGVRHRVLGHLDYFNNIPKSTGDGGIVDIYLKLKYYPVTNATIGADFHTFSLQNNVIYKSEALSKGLGQEVDLNISWDINKILNLRGGYSFYLVTDSMEKLQGIEPGNSRFPTWVWVMLTAKPVFLDTAQK